MATVDFSEQIKELGATLTSIEKVLDLDAMRAEITSLQQEVGAPDLWDDQANAQRVTGRPASSVTYSTRSYASTASRHSMLRKSRITGCGGCTSPRVRKCHCR